MKIEIDRKLLKYGIYVTVTAIAIYIAYLILSNAAKILNTTLAFGSYIIKLFKPLLIAIVISYLLYPVVKFLEKTLENNKIYSIKKESLRRSLAVILSYVTVIGLILVLIFGIYFMIGGQISKSTTISNVFKDLNRYFNSDFINISSVTDTLKNLNSPYLIEMKPYLIKAAEYIQRYAASNFSNFTENIVSFGSSVVTFFISLILSIYILNDTKYFINLWNKIYKLIFRNSSSGKRISYIFKTIHITFAKFIKGQLLEAFFVGILSSIALYIVGIDYAFVIGIIAGICNMIPYVGPLVGTVLAAIMALFSGDPIKILYAIIAMQVVQQIDNNLLAPKIVGESVGLHAVFTMMAILIGGNIGGLAGMLLAVPLAASFRVLFNDWYDKYIEKHPENK